MRCKNVLFIIFFVVMIVLIVPIEQGVGEEWKEQLGKDGLYLGGKLCYGEFTGTIIEYNYDFVNITINLSEY